MDGMGRGWGSAGAGAGVSSVELELVVVKATGGGEVCASEEVVCPRLGGSRIAVASKAQHHFEEAVIYFSPPFNYIAFKGDSRTSLGGRLYAEKFRNANGK